MTKCLIVVKFYNLLIFCFTTYNLDYGLNSMSYIWVGPKYEHFNYSDKIHKKYPFLKDLVLYKEGLFAIVTIYNNGTFNIKGMEGSYQNISPMDLGIGNTWNGRLICPKVESLK